MTDVPESVLQAGADVLKDIADRDDDTLKAYARATYITMVQAAEPPAIGSWLSAALDDPTVCEVMKADIRAWFEAGSPYPEIPLNESDLERAARAHHEARRVGAQAYFTTTWDKLDLPIRLAKVEHMRAALREVGIGYVGDTPFRSPTHWMPLPAPPLLLDRDGGE